MSAWLLIFLLIRPFYLGLAGFHFFSDLKLVTGFEDIILVVLTNFLWPMESNDSDYDLCEVRFTHK